MPAPDRQEMKMAIIVFCLVGPLLLRSQTKTPPTSPHADTASQSHSECSINANKSNIQIGSMTCTNLDVNLAKEFKAIADGTKRDTKLLNLVLQELQKISVQIQPSPINYGNLKQRTLDLASGIATDVIAWQDQEESLPPSKDRAEISRWHLSCSREASWRFHVGYQDRLQKIIEEYKKFDIENDQLEEIMSRVINNEDQQQRERARQIPSNQQTFEISYWDLRDIPKSLRELANNIP